MGAAGGKPVHFALGEFLHHVVNGWARVLNELLVARSQQAELVEEVVNLYSRRDLEALLQSIFGQKRNEFAVLWVVLEMPAEESTIFVSRKRLQNS